MKFIEQIEKEEYENFVQNHPMKSHFLQSYAWGEFSQKSKHLQPYYIGMKNDANQLVAASLLLEKKLPMGYTYLYAPRGFVLDFTDDTLLKTFTQFVIAFAKEKKAIFIKIDPDLIKTSVSWEEKYVKIPYDYAHIFQTLTKLGFQHQGFTKNFETMQPRYTFRIDLTQDLATITSHFTKTTNQRIQKAEKLKTEVRIGTEEDLPTFFELMKLTENRKDFISHDLAYYQNLYHIFNQDHKMTLFLGSIHLQKTIDYLKQEQQDLIDPLAEFPLENLSKSQNTRKKELIRQQEKLEQDIQRYQAAQQEYGNEITLSAHMIIEYGDKAWVLYAGNHNILSETYVNYKTYFEHIKYCKEKGLRIYDQFGTIGDLRDDNPRIGLHEFKKKFGGDYIEFLGEFDYVLKKVPYFFFTKLVPIYRNIIKKIAKQKERHSSK